MKIKLAAALAGLTLLAACTTTVVGSAKPKPGQGPIEQVTDPCSLLTAEQAKAVGVSPQGKFTKADKARKLPPSCDFKGPNGTSDGVTVTWSVDITVDQYYNGAQVAEELQFGGLKWTHYKNPFGDAFCSLMTRTEGGFVELLGTNLTAPEKSCDVAKAAAPLVSSHLGGTPVTSLPSPSTSASAPPSPLANVKACDMLKPDQLTALGLTSAGMEELGKTKPEQPGCEWPDTDGDRKQKPLDLWFGLTKPAKEWPYLDKGGEAVDAGGKKWTLFSDPGEDGVSCYASLEVSPTSSVMLTSGYLDDKAKICDLVKAAIPVVTPNLPS
ncbi:Protein of unknown function [Amycolatopsis xylanica]|uniref:DUF3558 domain-containing protein n=1 Tax=Amycolatopsis xylanica TaxID=589385 RepID=A0A1H3SU26_9PSEU|nr:DUF3558 family protein [Amycolatopsis xylanica]SDZ41197.1 Protein of unknown function [Amycolatopsis xylanica]